MSEIKVPTVEEIRKVYDGLPLSKLENIGISVESIKKSSHSHIIVTYPPYHSLPAANAESIYGGRKKRPNKREIAFYLHIPFCTGKCLYCAYHSFANQTSLVEEYLDTVEKELQLLSKTATLSNVTLNSIYIGGGTPTYLSAEQLERVFNAIKKNFEISKSAEITVEAEPDTILSTDGKEKLLMLKKVGVNRLSIGFQTFNDEILEFIKRRHTADEAIEAYLLAKSAGFDNINIDLITGLPLHTLEIWVEDLIKAVQLDPVSITCYPYYLKESSGMWSFFKKKPELFTTREELIKMHLFTNYFFNNLSYIQRPIRWFVKDERFMYKQQLFKWEQQGEQVGVGLSSYSYVDNAQYFNTSDIKKYIATVNNGELPIEKGMRLDEEDLMRRAIVFGLKSRLFIDSFVKRFNKHPYEIDGETWKKLIEMGLIQEEDRVIKLSLLGIIFCDEVAKEFYRKEYKVQ